MKKLLTLFIVPVVALLGFVGLSSAQFTTVNPYEEPTNNGGVDNLNVIGSGAGTEDGFVNVVRGFINWTLGILAFIALIILLYGGFMMVTAAGDEEKYKKGFTILRQAAIGLILIGIAWFIVSLIFWLVNLVGDISTDGGAGTGSQG